MPKAQPSYSLGKKDRLKSRKLIESLFREGKLVNQSPFRVLYILNNGEGLQAGVGVSSRHFKKAVDRNRVKRLVREAYRLQKNDLQAALKNSKKTMLLFIQYTGRELPDFQLVSGKLELILKKLLSLVNENNS